MAVKVSLRRVGAPTGRLIRKPETWGNLLDQARKTLDDASASVRIFVAGHTRMRMQQQHLESTFLPLRGED